MSAAWIAGGVRARALMRRRVGALGAREIAGCSSLAEAVGLLVAGPYQRDVRAGQSLEQAEHGVAATLLWHLRVLAGWQPRAGAELVRLLAGWFEMANVVEHLRMVTGEAASTTFQLGTLATAWPRLAATSSVAELRHALAASPWGDPGTDNPRQIVSAVQLGWAARVAGGVPQARFWAAGGAALLVARERFLLGRPVDVPALLGDAGGRGFSEFAARLPVEAAWALADVGDPADLWQAEERWWARVDSDARTLLRGRGFGPDAVVGCAALLAVDARRVRAALECAARGGSRLEVFDAIT
ncbi:hypothetical protein [Lentzea sp. HUAS12]|uniref:hypothetical protein n=1 Tax=Lentzea sp. HUAS12 TaxID=2951806 RepID=UPI00209FCE75|nr:hypothetical protein [Lentzea sp. HUAS12]USX53934.1 hypothetical protein ND450_07485 [Lentzea sp. HUAS12]